MNLFHRRPADPGPATSSWETAPQPRNTVAVPITDDELTTIDRLLHLAWTAQRASADTGDNPAMAMMRALRIRSGAAIAAAERAGLEPDGKTPLFAHEIESVERAYAIALDNHGVGLWPAEFKDLIEQLQVRLGYAQAVSYLDAVPVFSARLPALAAE